MRQSVLRLSFAAVLCLACTESEVGPRGAVSRPGGASGSGGSVSSSAGSTTAGGSAGVGGSAVAAAGSGGVSAGASGTAGSAGGGGTDTGPITHPDMRTVVYLPDYRGALATWTTQLPYSRMTYLNLCFADVDAAGTVTYKDVGLDAFVAAAHAKGVKVCMAIGGASVIDNGGVYATILQDGMRETFVTKLAQYAVDHQLDCIDVDLEGNGVNQYYEAFVTSLASKLHENGKEMTSAVSSWFGDKISDAAIQAFDFINVMAYDLHNPGGSLQAVQSASVEESTAEVEYWVKRGLPRSKAVYGVPFYGYQWTTGTGKALTYAEILAKVPEAATQDQVLVDGATTYLNSRATILAKAKLAREYGGIMVWELGQDAPGDSSLLKAIVESPP
jgi:spore germination protein YaaH